MSFNVTLNPGRVCTLQVRVCRYGAEVLTEIKAGPQEASRVEGWKVQAAGFVLSSQALQHPLIKEYCLNS